MIELPSWEECAIKMGKKEPLTEIEKMVYACGEQGFGVYGSYEILRAYVQAALNEAYSRGFADA